MYNDFPTDLSILMARLDPNQRYLDLISKQQKDLERMFGGNCAYDAFMRAKKDVELLESYQSTQKLAKELDAMEKFERVERAASKLQKEYEQMRDLTRWRPGAVDVMSKQIEDMVAPLAALRIKEEELKRIFGPLSYPTLGATAAYQDLVNEATTARRLFESLPRLYEESELPRITPDDYSLPAIERFHSPLDETNDRLEKVEHHLAAVNEGMATVGKIVSDLSILAAKTSEGAAKTSALSLRTSIISAVVTAVSLIVTVVAAQIAWLQYSAQQAESEARTKLEAQIEKLQASHEAMTRETNALKSENERLNSGSKALKSKSTKTQ